MEWHTMQIQQVLQTLRTDPTTGLRKQEAAHRLRQYGENRLQEQKHTGLLRKFFAQFADFMVIILLLAAGVSFLVARLRGENGSFDAVMILLIVVLNAILGCIQEYRAEKAIDALHAVCAPHSTVLRGGHKQIIESCLLVPGDIVFLKSGDSVPCDLRLLQSTELQTEESALTGESLPCEKHAERLCPADSALADRVCMAFGGTVVVGGHGLGVVTQTGMDTQLGRIAGMLAQEQTPPTPLQQKLSQMGKILGLGALGICGLIFLLGLWQKVPPLEMFLISVSLAVAAIPEGLTAVVTVVLAMGVRRMAGRRAIVRKLPAVETLGSTSVICSDKTGTLTQNKMTVQKIVTVAGTFSPGTPTAEALLQTAILCTNCTADADGTVHGEPTEAALWQAGDPVALQEICRRAKRIREIPFSSARKRMTTVQQTEDGFLVVTKGAPDVLLPRCTRISTEKGTLLLDAYRRAELSAQNAALAGQALRVIGIAAKRCSALPQSDEEIESDLTFLGLCALSDPPRPEAKNAVSVCKQAGIRPVMITGDHSATAFAIAQELGICEEPQQVLTGRRLDGFSDAQLEEQIDRYRVFARVSPAHKVRIVKALQKNGHTVAMTGDGVNDAPALKAADIGCAMGKNGTEAAKAAADMVLTDDNFATVVSAVKEGRGIFRNIRKVIHFLLSCNIGEILVVFLSFLLGLPTPLLAIQLLWVNLVTDSLPALALGLDPVEPEVMQQAPPPRNSAVFSRGEWFSICMEGCFIGVLTLLIYTIGRIFFDVDPAVPYIGRTMALAVLSLSQLVHAFTLRSTHPALRGGLFANKKLLWATAVCAALVVLVVSVPTFCTLFHTARLTALQWLLVLAFSLFPFFISEAEKLLNRS